MRQRLRVGIILICLATLTVLFFPAFYKWFWMISVSNAESKWRINHPTSYQLNGRASWAWHEHTFQITVLDDQIVDAKCELGYDENSLDGEKWCETQFEASIHLIPALYDKAREMLEFGNRISPRGNCFVAEFDKSNGAPTRLLLDCEDAYDEEEYWKLTISQDVP